MTFIVLALAVWRLSSLLAREDGLFDVFARLRFFLGVRHNEKSEQIGTNSISKGIICVWCNSIWVSFFASFLISNGIEDVMVYTLAMSAVAIFIEEKL